MNESMLDDLDHRIISALQIDPRIPWSSLVPVLGVDAVTLGRRWRKMTEEGVVWTTGLPVNLHQRIGAILIVKCNPRHVTGVVSAFSRMPQAMTIDIGMGNLELVVTVVERSEERLAGFLFDVARTTRHVRSVQTHLLTNPWKHGEQWRLGALTPEEVKSIPPAKTARKRAAKSISPELENAVYQALGPDARTPATRVAELGGVSVQRAQDAIDVMRNRGQIQLRTDLDRAFSGWPVHLWYFMDVPPAMLEKVGTAVSTMQEVRFVSSVAGSYNLIFSAWMRRLAQAHTFERLLDQKFQNVAVGRRSIILKTPKHLGHLFDDNGRCTDTFVPMPTSKIADLAP
ncbi:Lrp/AsnC family transcriptional regulator [Arthrobacter sp. MMS18-M83]|uniref:Lrp/AsnC family transcriptional regulator n=1 Tax=Arthrobacter sp. MMS18-M83 TaxID=2996261 RepID=UPI00227AF465|nr:Lrp/AsnC family transcriptional regulator [Arthrobacter sp. MMS18-M83]WAH97771.1 Lrp/AsnC family transcriptional regulator [Arthrobacter sp. MMS18-M83]